MSKFKTRIRSEGDKTSGSLIATPKASVGKKAIRAREDGECDSEPESPLKRLDRSKALDAKKIKDSLKKSKRKVPAESENSSEDNSDSSDCDQDGATGSFLQCLNAIDYNNNLLRLTLSTILHTT